MKRPPKTATPILAGAPTWMVTFGDLMALLFTLFVLLFTYSTIDAEKYKSLAGSLRQAFGSTKNEGLIGDMGGPMATITLSPEVPEDQKIKAAKEVFVELSTPKLEIEGLDDLTEADMVSEDDVLKAAKEAKERRAQVLENELKNATMEGLTGSRIEVEREGVRVLLRFPSEIAFVLGSAEINNRFEVVLKSLIPILQATSGKIVVSGHTDNVPISPGGRYRSNWELSAGRAAAVVQVLMSDEVISRERVTLQGFGDSRPLADNDTEENRARNRRVEISIVTAEELSN